MSILLIKTPNQRFDIELKDFRTGRYFREHLCKTFSPYLCPFSVRGKTKTLRDVVAVPVHSTR